MDNTELNRVALVTGSGRRIGAEIVRKLHAEGMRVIVHYRGSKQAATAVAEELNSLRIDSAATVSFDLHDTDQLPTFAQQVIDIWGRLDVLVNNASTFYPTPIQEITPQQWEDLVGINLKAPLFLSKALAAELKLRAGNIVNIVDIHAQRPLKGYTAYSVAKAGLGMLTKSLARELAPAVRVNGVAPGAILWPEVEAYEPIHQEIIERTALKREGHPRDIAATVWFLISASDYITGQIIAVDGGRTLSN